MMPMLFASISRPELLDHLPDSIDARASRPVLLTLRRSPCFAEEAREALLERLLELHPPFCDLEADSRASFLENMLQKHPRTKFILSYHNFEETPGDLEPIYRAMARYPAYSYKIAAKALSANDALRMLLFARKHPGVSAICMGERGEFARVLGPVVGNPIDYACLEEPLAPGQLSVRELVEMYRYRTLNPQTALYGLIGDPVAHSRSPQYHNEVFRRLGRNAVYVKMAVRSEELSEFFPLAKELGVRGLSVTMPLKEKVLPFVDRGDLKLGAINTLVFKQGEITGVNTDGQGALDALEKRGAVRGKTVVLLGAGGAARAIALEAKRRGALLFIVNRTREKGEALARAVGGVCDFPSRYDILINCTPVSPSVAFQPSTLVMDIINRETQFLLEAKSAGCQTVLGEEMFINQAAAQAHLWH